LGEDEPEITMLWPEGGPPAPAAGVRRRAATGPILTEAIDELD
jgi:hypothetical protein